ncbi:MAG: DUF721 domain-containing protein [Alphaproteobacteria bacterium]
MNDSDDGAVRKRRGMTTLGQSIGRVASPALRKRGFAEAAIITGWATIVGRPLCEHTQPSRIVFPRGQRHGGTLHLLVSGAFAPDVQHLAPQIIERINGHFGYGAIARLELHHGRLNPVEHRTARRGAPVPEPPPALRAVIARTGDKRLGTALDRLARAREAARAADEEKSDS